MRDHNSSLADQSWQGQVELRELRAGQEPPALCAYLLDARGRPLAIADVAADGRFALHLSPTGRAGSGPRHIAVGPPPGAGRDLPRAPLQRWRTPRPDQKLRLRIAPGNWLPWSSQRRELRGRLLWRPFDDALAAQLAAIASHPGSDGDAAARALRHCLSGHGYPVREGRVQVYRRWCYSRPPQANEPRFRELLEHLQSKAAALPQIHPALAGAPRRALAEAASPRLRRQLATFIHDGALDQTAILAPRHLAVLQTGNAAACAAHLAAHPQLHCQPGAVSPVADGEIGADGQFRIRWHELLQLMPAGCHEEFSLVISQCVAGRPQVIYDGIRAGHWARASASGQLEVMNLVSLHPAARCLPSPRPGRAGQRPRVRLVSIGERAAGPALAAWGTEAAPLRGLLPLRYRFEPALRACGARYYRVRVSSAGGQPGESATLLAPAWTRHRPGGGPKHGAAYGHPEVIGLGPQSVGEQTGLLRIPYEDEHEWQAGQAHALLDSREFADGRYRLTLELFDAQGRRLTPRDTGQAGDVAAAFDFVSANAAATQHAPALTEWLQWDNAPSLGDPAPPAAQGGGATFRIRTGVRDAHPGTPERRHADPGAAATSTTVPTIAPVGPQRHLTAQATGGGRPDGRGVRTRTITRDVNTWPCGTTPAGPAAGRRCTTTGD